MSKILCKKCGAEVERTADNIFPSYHFIAGNQSSYYCSKDQGKQYFYFRNAQDLIYSIYHDINWHSLLCLNYKKPLFTKPYWKFKSLYELFLTINSHIHRIVVNSNISFDK